eukprot:TRINITY_DN23837_c0_g2_i1.p1 TRINITY_DN23837_c0_g2~~TRINITY_DN23837_c0_g2_i1.p1  ORF type:complete len:430 (+),score=79.72 TRINITY_DN23837_c0_g2_i1:511-1800(+)
MPPFWVVLFLSRVILLRRAQPLTCCCRATGLGVEPTAVAVTGRRKRRGHLLRVLLLRSAKLPVVAGLLASLPIVGTAQKPYEAPPPPLVAYDKNALLTGVTELEERAQASTEFCPAATALSGVRPLVVLLRDGFDWQKEQAASQLAERARTSNADKMAIEQARGIEFLIALLKGTEGQKLQASRALGWLAAELGPPGPIVGRKPMDGGTPPFSSLAGAGLTPDQQRRAVAGAFCHPLAAAVNRDVMVRGGVLNPLVQLATHGNRQQTLEAVITLRNIALGGDENQAAILNAKALDPLVHLARFGAPLQKENALGLFRNIAARPDRSMNPRLEHAGVLPPLVELSRHGTPGQKALADETLQSLRHEPYIRQAEVETAKNIDKGLTYVEQLGALQSRGLTVAGVSASDPISTRRRFGPRWVWPKGAPGQGF